MFIYSINIDAFRYLSWEVYTGRPSLLEMKDIFKNYKWPIFIFRDFIQIYSLTYKNVPSCDNYVPNLGLFGKMRDKNKLP